MGIADKIRGAVQGVATEGTERAQALADARKRSKLVSELGELTYRRAKGETVDDTLVDAVIASIDDLETDSSGADEERTSSEGSSGSAAEETGAPDGESGDAETP